MENLRQECILFSFSKTRSFLMVLLLHYIISLQGIKPEKKTNDAGKPVDDYWPAAKRVGLHDSAIKS